VCVRADGALAIARVLMRRFMIARLYFALSAALMLLLMPFRARVEAWGRGAAICAKYTEHTVMQSVRRAAEVAALLALVGDRVQQAVRGEQQARRRAHAVLRARRARQAAFAEAYACLPAARAAQRSVVASAAQRR